MRRLKILVVLAFIAGAMFIFGLRENTSALAEKRSALTAPMAPTGVSATDSDHANKVVVLWNTMRGATTYRIFRNTTNNSGTATEVGTSLSNQFHDTSAEPAITYFYWVRAEGSGGNSAFSTADQGTRGVLGESPGPFSPLEPPSAPVGNTLTAAKASLGKTLFWDEQMSSTLTVSCGTCHRPATGGSDPRSIIGDPRSLNPGFDGIAGTADDVVGSPGVPRNNADGTYAEAPFFGFKVQVTGRKAPSYLNNGYPTLGLFWDGRANSTFRDPLTNAIVLDIDAALESQVLGPPLSDSEMGHMGRNWNDVAAQIAVSKPLALSAKIPDSLETWIDGRSYPELFEEAFGTPEVSPVRIAMAIASHERQIITDRAPIDRWAVGLPAGMTASEINGAELFVTNQCSICHSNPIFSDNSFHNIGVRPPNEDRGRGAVTNDPINDGEFRTTTLRNVELHAPYMHNGRFATLEEVVEFYNRGGDHDAPNINRGFIRPLGLTTQEKADLVAFMKRPLTDPRVVSELPPFDRPQLYTESNRVPQLSGTGRPGAGALVPNAIALEPPMLGNPSFTVAVSEGATSANAVVVINSSDPGVGTSIPATGSFARATTTLTANGNGSVSLQIPNNPALVGQTFYGRWYVTDAAAANGFSVSRLFTFTVFGDAKASVSNVHLDLDGDGKTDIGIFRPTPGEWWYTESSTGTNRAFQFGSQTDRIVPAHYSEDGKTDVAIWRPSSGEWFIMRSEDFSFYSFPFGTTGDIPLTGDFDGDGLADSVAYRPSNQTWYIKRSGGDVEIIGFGLNGDIPQIGDYDGDGVSDIAVFRPSTGVWWIRRSTGGVVAAQFGISTDKPVAADYSGDGKTDIAFFRPSTGYWYILRSEDGSFFSLPFGANGDIPSPGDYDGDGKFDFAVFRPSNGTWYISTQTQGIMIIQYGINGDYPLPAAYVP